MEQPVISSCIDFFMTYRRDESQSIPVEIKLKTLVGSGDYLEFHITSRLTLFMSPSQFRQFAGDFQAEAFKVLAELPIEETKAA